MGRKHTHTHCCTTVYTDSTRWYAVMWHQILYFLLFATKERSSTERRMEGEIAEETSMRPLKCECLGSAAYGQLPSWVHTGLTASTVNVIRCQTYTKIGEVSTAARRPPVTKSPFLSMTSQSTTSPAVLMGTKSCTKILIFPTRFSEK